MRGGIRGPALMAVVVLSAINNPSAAWAQKGRRVVVEPFSGPSSDRFRDMVLSALGKMSSVVVIGDKKVASVEADLGLINLSDAYVAVGRELKLSAFIGGKIEGGKKPKARLTVRDGTEGSVIGDQNWTGPNPAKLLSAIGENLSTKLGDLLDKVKTSGSGGAAGIAEKPQKQEAPPPPPPPTVRVAKVTQPPEEKKEERKEAKAEKKAEKVAAADSNADGSEFDAPKKSKKKKKSDDETTPDADAGVSASGGGEGGFLALGNFGLDVAVGTKLYGRKFTYNDTVPGWGGQQGNSQPLVPAPNLALEFFPTRYIGVTAAFEYSFAISSKDATDSIYNGKSMAYSVGVKGQYDLGPALVNATLGYGDHTFEMLPIEGDMNPPQVAGVSYKHVRLGVGARVKVTDMVTVFGGATYMHILQAGEIHTDYFPGATFKGGEAFAGVAVPLGFLMKNLEARGTVEIQRIVFDMHSISDDLDVAGMKGNGRAAGGATDQYMGVNIALAYRAFP